MYESCLRRSIYQGKYEFTFLSESCVIVHQLSSGIKIVLKSAQGEEIFKVDVIKDTFLVARTAQTLLLGELMNCKLSEVKERFL